MRTGRAAWLAALSCVPVCIDRQHEPAHVLAAEQVVPPRPAVQREPPGSPRPQQAIGARVRSTDAAGERLHVGGAGAYAAAERVPCTLENRLPRRGDAVLRQHVCLKLILGS
jgi:hypothetical protein